MRSLVALAATAGILLVGTGSALAAPPLHESLEPEADPGTIDCGTFDDNFVDFFGGTATTFFDGAGNPVRVVLHVEHHSDDTNSVSGLAIHEHGHFTVTIDLITGATTVTGNQEVANRPGAGVVVQDVGRVIFDADDELVFFAGGTKHSELFGGDQVLCDALA